ncbi:rubredoxin-type Fe(Cys)4 protein [Salinisphaera sp. PC39]
MTCRYRCPACGYTYDEALGDEDEGFEPGTPWSAVPEDWFCPDCAVRDKADFELVEQAGAGSQAVSQSGAHGGS